MFVQIVNKIACLSRFMKMFLQIYVVLIQVFDYSLLTHYLYIHIVFVNHSYGPKLGSCMPTTW
jgi:hypothetical protein